MENQQLPDWYWKKGLHDAFISGCNEIKMEYDYSSKNPIRNCIELDIQSVGALFEIDIKQIKLYNYKIISDLKNPKNLWWIEDVLNKEEDKNGKFILTIYGLNKTLKKPSQLEKNKTQFIVKFEKAEVVRNER